MTLSGFFKLLIDATKEGLWWVLVFAAIILGFVALATMGVLLGMLLTHIAEGNLWSIAAVTVVGVIFVIGFASEVVQWWRLYKGEWWREWRGR